VCRNLCVVKGLALVGAGPPVPALLDLPTMKSMKVDRKKRFTAKYAKHAKKKNLLRATGHEPRATNRGPRACPVGFAHPEEHEGRQEDAIHRETREPCEKEGSLSSHGPRVTDHGSWTAKYAKHANGTADERGRTPMGEGTSFTTEAPRARRRRSVAEKNERSRKKGNAGHFACVGLFFWPSVVLCGESLLSGPNLGGSAATGHGPRTFNRKIREKHTLLRATRSEERRVGKECRSRWSPYH